MTEVVITGAAKNPWPLHTTSREHLIANAAMVVADLDQTLAFTKQAHMALIGAFMANLDSSLPHDEILTCYSALRGQAYANILEGMRELHNNHASNSIDASKFISSFFGFARQYTAQSGSEKALEMPGAREVLETVHRLGTPLVVCTGSPRPLAERFLAEAGIADLVEGKNLFCWGDTNYSKSDPDFWAPILHDMDRQRVIALDDHPHSAEYLLKVAGVGATIVLPSVGLDAFTELNAKFPGRILMIKDSWTNWL